MNARLKTAGLTDSVRDVIQTEVPNALEEIGELPTDGIELAERVAALVERRVKDFWETQATLSTCIDRLVQIAALAQVGLEHLLDDDLLDPRDP